MGPPRIAEATFWLLSSLVIFVWALSLGLDLLPFARATAGFQSFLMKHSGASILCVSLLGLGAVSMAACLSALRSRAIPQASSSILLITAVALRAVQIISDGSVSVMDANILGGIWLAAAILYYGPIRLWWLVLMPLSSLAAFTPLFWLEFYKGAPNKSLIDALVLPTAAFALGSIIIVLRDLRTKAVKNSFDLRAMKLRGCATQKELRSMELDMKTLSALLMGPSSTPVMAAPAVSLEPTETTEFNSPLFDQKASEICSFEDIDVATRQLLDDARARVQGRPVRLTLTAPTGSNLPIAIRGHLPTIAHWIQSSIQTSIDALGGFPNGAVRVTLRAGLSSVAISVEDNGRGMGELAQAKQGHSEGRMTMIEIRSDVERLGGRFDVQARLGVGARITIELPRVDAFAAASPRAARTTAATKGFGPATSSSQHA